MKTTYVTLSEQIVIGTAEDETLLTIPAGVRFAVVSGLEEGEPIFSLRARDAMALGLVNLWREQTWTLLSDERLEQLTQDLDRWVQWRRDHVELVRDPD